MPRTDLLWSLKAILAKLGDSERADTKRGSNESGRVRPRLEPHFNPDGLDQNEPTTR